MFTILCNRLGFLLSQRTVSQRLRRIAVKRAPGELSRYVEN